MEAPLNMPRLAKLVRMALDEDGVSLDITADCLVPASAKGRGRLVSRAPGTICGMFLMDDAGPLMAAFPNVKATPRVQDGARVARGDTLAELEGPARSLLGLERTLLNFLQRLSGIATETARYVACVGDGATRIQETRKTVPGWRELDKLAVRVGGGLNHRRGLDDRVLVKENHLCFVDEEDPRERIREAVRRCRRRVGADVVIEIEVESLGELDAALETDADIVMLDDFTDDDVSAAVRRRQAMRPSTVLEVSGGVTLERIPTLVALGVDRISVGALTHSVRALDLAVELDLGATR